MKTNFIRIIMVILQLFMFLLISAGATGRSQSFPSLNIRWCFIILLLGNFRQVIPLLQIRTPISIKAWFGYRLKGQINLGNKGNTIVWAQNQVLFLSVAHCSNDTFPTQDFILTKCLMSVGKSTNFFVVE